MRPPAPTRSFRLGSMPILAGLLTTTAWAQAPIPISYVTDAPVYAMTQAHGRIYIGGKFTQVGAVTGGALATDANTGEVIGFPRVAGAVYAIAPDGAGGWYLGGAFSHVGGAPRANLAHVRADRSVTDWNPGAPRVVSAILRADSTVYYAWTEGGGNGRVNAADAVTGAPRPVSATLGGGGIRALAKVGSTLYVGGDFALANDVVRPGLAALDAATGNVLGSFDPRSDLLGQRSVYAIAANDSLVFVGGYFGYFGGQERQCLAALEASTGIAIPWHTEDRFSHPWVMSLALRGSTLYVGGSFESMGGQPRSGLAAVDVATGLALDWNPGTRSTVSTLSLSGSTLYTAGSFPDLGRGTASWDAVTAEERGWHPTPDLGGYSTICADGGVVYVGGRFSTVGARPRSGIAALDARTGALLDWNPGADDVVHAIAVHDTTVYAGGRFTRIGGEPRGRIAALEPSTGRATAWNPGADGRVYALAATASTVYAGGEFTTLGGLPRYRLAAIEASSGSVTDWAPAADLAVRGIALRGSTVYVGGDFTRIDDQPRNHLAAVDAGTGTVTAWDPVANNDVSSVAVVDSRLYASGWFTRIGGLPRGRMAAIDLESAAPLAWNPDADGSIKSFAFDGSVVYVGGEFTALAGQSRSFLAAIDAATAAPIEWSPNPNAEVRAVAAAAGRVFAGGDFSVCDGLPSPYLTSVPVDETTPALLSLFQAEPGGEGIALRWRFSGPVSSSWLERADLADGPWIRLAAEPRVDGEWLTVVDREVEPGRSYFYRVVGEQSGRTIRSDSIVATAGTHPEELALTSLYPSPASGPVTVEFSIPREAEVRLEVLDLQGRRVDLLLDGNQRPGHYRAIWRGRATAGIYFVRCAGGGRVAVRRVAVMR